jgi:DNA-binding IclR family transcriptional regulator
MVSQLLGDEQVPLMWHRAKGSRHDEAQVLASVAKPYPLWATASGRALLGSLQPAQRPRLLPPEPFPQLTSQSLTDWADVRDAINAGVKDGLHLEHGEVHSGLWCCSVALEPTHADERLAIVVICVGEPNAQHQARIHRVLRQEAFNTTTGMISPS